MSDILRNWLGTCKRAVIFTGAGVSTESGIPDFRSPGGIWTRMKPIMFQDFIASEATRIEAWKRKFAMDKEISTAKPNSGHKAIAQLVKQGTVSHVITQNIDNLHQDSGIAAMQIIELHGNATYATCLDCHARFELSDIEQIFKSYEQKSAPTCDICGGIVKTATISFGQSMPEHEMERAQNATLACDLFIAIGSSLQVYPAAGFPVVAKRNGAKLVIINREATDLDDMADLVLHEEIGACLTQLTGINL